jgi:hypothetical protein
MQPQHPQQPQPLQQQQPQPQQTMGGAGLFHQLMGQQQNMNVGAPPNAMDIINKWDAMDAAQKKPGDPLSLAPPGLQGPPLPPVFQPGGVNNSFGGIY